jgi:hypothetical protein
MTATNCKVGDLAIVTSATLPENIGQIVEILGPPTGHPINANWSGTTWQVRTASGRPTLVYRFWDGKLKRHADGPVPDSRLRPIRGLEDERGCAGERDIADGMFTAMETLETADMGADLPMRAGALV